jgi:hypothetical protein
LQRRPKTLANGEPSTQGRDKLNIRDLGNGQDAVTITSGGKVGIGTTNPGFKLEIDSPDQLSLHVAGPTTGVGAGISLSTTNAGANVNSWEILAGGSNAAQGPSVLNFRHLTSPVPGSKPQDILTMGTFFHGLSLEPREFVGIGTTNPQYLLDVNGEFSCQLALVKGNIVCTGTHTCQAAVVNGALDVGGDAVVNGTLNVGGDIVMPAADFAEDFAVEASEAIEPGAVMVLDENGILRASNKAYDRKVAGVISGAGDYRPGLILDRRESSSGRLPLALVGKVYCKVDAAFGAIEVGDLLTTSETPGHAMKATDQFKAFGAVIGKAMGSLGTGRGLIPILIALQ